MLDFMYFYGKMLKCISFCIKWDYSGGTRDSVGQIRFASQQITIVITETHIHTSSYFYLCEDTLTTTNPLTLTLIYTYSNSDLNF